MLEISCTGSNMKTARAWDIMNIKLKLGSGQCNNLLYIHVFLGCGTTSSVFGIGKMLALMRYLKDCNFRKCASVVVFFIKVKIFQWMILYIY